MATPKTDDDVIEFMTTGSRTGKLAVVRKDGRPHVVPIWFDVDRATGELVFMTGAKGLKANCIRRDPRVSICCDDETFPFAFARVDGTAAITTHAEDPDGLRHWATETCRRYVGDDRAEEFGARNSGDDEVLVRITPSRMVGAFGISD